jgi:UDP-glucose 4-epimerase
MTVLVTGGAGYIGSHMVHELLAGGEQVVVLDNLTTGFRFLVPPGVPFVVGSTGDRDLVARTLRHHNVTAIIHFAASIVVPDSVRDPLGYYRNNTLNTCNLIDVAIESGVRQFIFSSTAAVYGNAEHVPVREDEPTAPIAPYGTSKLMSEIMLHDAAKAHGMRFVVLRYFNVAGADPKGRTGQSTPQATHLIKVACEAALGKRAKLDVYGTDYPTPDGTCQRDYIHVSDLAAAHSAALAHLRAGRESATFNCGYGRGASVFEVISSVKRVSGVDFRVDIAPRRDGDPAALIANVERIHASLDWRPRFQDLDTIVTHALAWERSLADKRETAAA